MRFLFIGILIISLALNGIFFTRKYQNQIVVSVPDGDSVQLADGRRVRLLGVDAPERGRCGADEARQRLEELVKDAHIGMTEIVIDDYGRQLANIYNRGIFVNGMLVKEGLVKYSSVGNSHAETMKKDSQSAQQEKKGIYSETCRPTSAPEGCTIKGNTKSGKIYHLPGCKNYNQTLIDLAYGDHWFCTEQEAQEVGFVKAEGCK